MDSVIPRDDLRIVFIGGTGRSGTNVVKAILGTHPEIAILPFEYRFIIDPDGIVDFYRSYTATWSPYLADRRLKRLELLLSTLAEEPALHRLVGDGIRAVDPPGHHLSPRCYHGWNLAANLPKFKEHVQSLLSELIDFSFPAYWVGTESYRLEPHLHFAGPRTESELAPILGGFVRRVLGDFLAMQGKRVYAEDNTWNTLFARELLQLVPEAKILHVYRDPRDVVASFTHQRWCPTDVRQAALWYRAIMEHWFTVRESLPNESCHEFSLENLVGSTEQVLRDVCRFLGVAYDPVLLHTDLSKAHTGRWKRDFSKGEQRTLGEILDPAMAKLGYAQA